MTTTQNNFTADVLNAMKAAMPKKPLLVGIVCNPRFAERLRKESANASPELPPLAQLGCGVPIYECVLTKTWMPFYDEKELREYLNRG